MNSWQQCGHFVLWSYHSINSRIAIQRSSSPPPIMIQLVIRFLLLRCLHMIQANHPAFTGSEGTPEDGTVVAGSIFTAVIIYAVRSTFPFIRSLELSI